MVHIPKITDLFLKELSKTLTDRAYTLYIHLKRGTTLDCTHLVFMFNFKFFYSEARFTHSRLGRTCQYSNEDLDVYMSKFYEKPLGCCNPVDEKCLLMFASWYDRGTHGIPGKHVFLLFL